jgi:hypothetical protein
MINPGTHSLQKLGYGVDDWRTDVRFPARTEIDLLSTASRPDVGAIHSPVE